jgi:hypothetical protein
VLSLARRAFWPPYRNNALAHVARDTSVGVSRPHDFAVRNSSFVRMIKTMLQPIAPTASHAQRP